MRQIHTKSFDQFRAARAGAQDGTGVDRVFPRYLNRTEDDLGVWEHKGKVAAVGIGHSPTSRRWDGKPDTSMGAQSIDALRKAMDDAGVRPDEVDGLVISDCVGSVAPGQPRWWYNDGRPPPEDVVNAFNQTDEPFDGIAQLSHEWLLKNMPELTNVQFTMYGGNCMAQDIPVASQAIGDGLAHTVLVLKSWLNIDQRYRRGGKNADNEVTGNYKYSTPWGPHISNGDAQKFARYCWKYGKTHDMMAPFVVNSRKNGLMFPEGYWAQNRPEELTVDDYINARWINKPTNLFDNDIPIHSSSAYLFTTAERARDMKQKPAYILNHVTARGHPDYRAGAMGDYGPSSLEAVEAGAALTGKRLLEGAGITANDLSFENMFDGFSLFHVFHIEGLGIYGLKPGEALDLFQEDISVEGRYPVNPSGGDIGSGRNRCWMFTDCIQQIQGRAGKRQIKRRRAEVGVAGGMIPPGGDYTVFGSSPD